MLCADPAPSGTSEQACAFAGYSIRTRSVTRDTGTVQNHSRKTKGDQEGIQLNKKGEH